MAAMKATPADMKLLCNLRRYFNHPDHHYTFLSQFNENAAHSWQLLRGYAA